MAIASPSSVSLGSSHCQFCETEGICCSMSAGASADWIRPPFDGRRAPDLASISLRCKNPFVGAAQSHWLRTRQDLCLSKVWVAADHSDSVPDSSSNYMFNRGYHPLEEVKECKRSRDSKLTSAEIARTTVEANSSALLVFPGMVHCEPHGHISWADFRYVIDDYGDIFFEIFDDENILQDREASNPVNVLIGMDISIYGNRKVAGEYNISDSDSILFNDDHFEIVGPEVSDIPVEWGMPDTSRWVHPMYFSKCIAKVVNTKLRELMDHPSNGISIVGCLRPAFIDEESYLRRLFQYEDSDDYVSDWKDGENMGFDCKGDGTDSISTFYKLEIMRIELFSVYGGQSAISLQDFQDAEPDVLVPSASAIVERFSENGMNCSVALKALCRKKGLSVERANLIGVDSLGMDVRVSSGVEARTLRFSFKYRATSGGAVEKQIQQLLFPRSRRKKLRTHGDGLRDLDSF